MAMQVVRKARTIRRHRGVEVFVATNLTCWNPNTAIRRIVALAEEWVWNLMQHQMAREGPTQTQTRPEHLVFDIRQVAPKAQADVEAVGYTLSVPLSNHEESDYFFYNIFFLVRAVSSPPRIVWPCKDILKVAIHVKTAELAYCALV